MQEYDAFTDALFALDIGTLEVLHAQFAVGVQAHRENGYPALAEWYDGIGASVSAMLDSRRGDAIDTGSGPNLVERTAALSYADLHMAGLNFLRILSGVPKCPVGDFWAATMGLLNVEGLRRQGRYQPR